MYGLAVRVGRHVRAHPQVSAQVVSMVHRRHCIRVPSRNPPDSPHVRCVVVHISGPYRCWPRRADSAIIHADADVQKG